MSMFFRNSLNFLGSQKSALNHLDYQSLKRKPNKKADYGNWHSKSLDDNILILDTLQVNETGLTNEVNKMLLLLIKLYFIVYYLYTFGCSLIS